MALGTPTGEITGVHSDLCGVDCVHFCTTCYYGNLQYRQWWVHTCMHVCICTYVLCVYEVSVYTIYCFFNMHLYGRHLLLMH